MKTKKLSLPVKTEGVKTFITQEFQFKASHYLPNHDGICKKPHEHEYKLRITLAGPVEKNGPKEGMIYDFADLEKIVHKKIICIMEGKSLPDIFDFPTTIENLSFWIAHKLNKLLPEHLWVKSVTLYEEPTRSATCKIRKP